MNSPTPQQTLELLDIYDVYYEPWWLNERLWYGIYAIVGIAVCVFVYLLIRKLMPQKKLSYWEQALIQIERLGNDLDNPKLFYGQLTDILKRYLQERYALPLVGKTDTELLAVLEHDNAVPQILYQDIKTIFDGVVYVKFAHHSVAVEQMRYAQRTAAKIIKETHVVHKK
jgi:hypothetical protein